MRQVLGRFARPRNRSRIIACATIVVMSLGLALVLVDFLSVTPAEASVPRTVKVAPYRIPDKYLSVPYRGGSFGYGYPPAYGFDTADHNIQCYVAQGEDSTVYACGIQSHRWTLPTSRLNCKKPRYVGVLGFAAAQGVGGECSDIKMVPRERDPGSKPVTGGQVNRVLPSGSRITVFSGLVTCTASGHGRTSAITCDDNSTKRKVDFRISYDALQLKG